MADEKTGSAATGFILGAVVVVLVGVVVYLWTGGPFGGGSNDATITIKVPDLKTN